MKQDWLVVPSAWRNRLLVAYFGDLAFWFVFQFVDMTRQAMAESLSATADGQYISDYVEFYIVDKMLCSPDKGRIYQPEVQHEWQHRLLGTNIKQYFSVENSPLVFLFMMPLCGLPMNLSHWMWDVLTLLYAGIMCYALCAATKADGVGKFLPLMIFIGVAGSAPGHMEFEFGQVSYFVLGSTMGYFLALLKRKDWLAGFFLALAAAKIHLLPLLVLACVPNRQFKAVFSMLIILILTFTVLGFVWGWSNYIDYPVSLMSGDGSTVHKAMPSLRGLLCNLGMSIKGSMMLDLAVLFIAALMLLVKGWKTANMNTLALRLWCSVLIAVTLILTPHCFSNYSVLQAAPAALFLPEYFKGVFLVDARARVVAALLLLSPVLSWFSFALLSFRIPEAYAYGCFNICIVTLLISLINDVVSKKFICDTP